MTETILDRLSTVSDPDLDDDVVSLGLVGDVETADRTATVPIALGAPYSPAETELLATVRDRIRDAGYEPDIVIDVDDPTLPGRDGLPPVIAVTAGKGGVGTSTVAANLAAGMARRGAAVGLLDADVETPTTPALLGVDGYAGDGPVRETAHDVELCYGAVPADDRPKESEVLSELWATADWSGLDYVVVDVPSGSRERRVATRRAVPVTDTVVVTTPNPVAVDGARSVAQRRRADGEPVLGAVVNMARFVCPDCDTLHGTAGNGTPDLDLALLEQLPLDPAIRGQTGTPPVLGSEDESTTALLRSLTRGTMDAIGRRRRESHAQRHADQSTG